MRSNGKNMVYVQDSKLESRGRLSLPPDGYCNFDAMAGADLGFNATLQKQHTVSGPEYIRQRKSFGLGEDDMFAHVFVVPKFRFDNGWISFQQFQWSSDEVATNRKRRRVKKGANSPSPVCGQPKISDKDKATARDSMHQFVVTLEFQEDEG